MGRQEKRVERRFEIDNILGDIETFVGEAEKKYRERRGEFGEDWKREGQEGSRD